MRASSYNFLASDATPFRILKAFLANGTARELFTFHVYNVCGCKTEIEIPEAIPDYEGIDVTQALLRDGRSAQAMLATLGRGDVLLEDRAYDSDDLREALAARGARANAKLMPNRVNLPPFNKRLYRRCHLVERFVNKLKNFRAVATRYDKRDDNYLASVELASIRIWVRFNESVT